MYCSHRQILICRYLLLFVTTPVFTNSFSIVSRRGSSSRQTTFGSCCSRSSTSTVLSVTTATSSSSSTSSPNLSVILYGPGDLRTSDHEGLFDAVTSSNDDVLPLLILDETSLSNLPMVVSHPLETASLYHSAVTDLNEQLELLNLSLNVVRATSGWSAGAAVAQLLSEWEEQYDSVTIRVCDLGPADNDMGYGAYGNLGDFVTEASLSSRVTVRPWRCVLREDAWESCLGDGDNPDNYPDYYDKWRRCDVAEPRGVPPPLADGRGVSLSDGGNGIPTLDEFMNMVIEPSLLSSSVRDDVVSSSRHPTGTGLWGTHWGGPAAPPSPLGESGTLSFLRHHRDHNKFSQEILLQQFRSSKNDRLSKRHPRSLEHASLEWMSQREGTLVEGELVTRFLAAPLSFGCVSRRQLWHLGNGDGGNGNGGGFFGGGRDGAALKDLAEGREWHELLAAMEMRKGNEFRYWRWHGFLCRYYCDSCSTANEYDINRGGSTEKEEELDLVLVHGFGASAAQMTKTLNAVANTTAFFTRHLAPDLIGFGHCQKPALSYTQYLWEQFVMDFLKTHTESGFILGGNSIGGYVSMAVAADDTVVEGVSASGCKGTGRCEGLVLMNSAGRILSKEDVEKVGESVSVLEATIGDMLGDCRPPPRVVAKLFGTALLSYLRPRIQSICTSLYPANPAAVDQQLASTILRDSLDPGAINVMISGSKLPPPRTANELLGAEFGCAAESDGGGVWRGEIMVAQGMKDPLNDARTRAALLEGLRDGIDVRGLDGAGHCPHDELPEDVAMRIVQWARDKLALGEGVKKRLNEEEIPIL